MNNKARKTGQTELGVVIVTLFGILLLAALIIAWMVGMPKYYVYSAHMAGEAELAQADANRQIQVREATAKRDAATMLAQAEVERAKGVAKANEIIGKSLEGNDAYLRYLWIDKLAEGTQRETIYVPSQGGLPILESGRLNNQAQLPAPTK